MGRDPRSSGTAPRRASSLSRRRLLQRLAGLMVVGAAAPLAAACGQQTPPPAKPVATVPPSGQAAPAKPAKPAESKPAAPAQPTAAPKAAASSASDSRVLTILQPADPATLDPIFGVSPVVSNILHNVIETLADFDDKGNLQPVLAERWEVRPDNLTWRFYLRKGITFHNGEPMNAQAVKFTMDRMADPNIKGVNDIHKRIGLDKVVVVDEHTVDVITQKPTDMVEALLYRWYVLAPSYYGSVSLEEAARKPIGTGPYQVKEYRKDDRVVLEAWDGYRMGAAPIRNMVFRFVPELATRVAELETGNADIVVNLDPDQIDVIGNNPKLRVATVDSLRRVFISINTERHAALKDARVRQAFNHAINFDAINKSLLQGKAERMALPVNGSYWVNPKLKPFAYDVERAKQLMTAAGASGLNLELNLAAGTFVKSLEICQAVASDLGKIGVNVEVKPLEDSVFRKMVNDRKTNDLFFVALASQLYGPKDLQSFAPEAAWNATGWPGTSPRGQEWVKLMAEMDSTFDRAKKREIFHKATELFYEEAPAIFLWNQIDFYGVSKRTDWEPKPLIEFKLYGTKWVS